MLYKFDFLQLKSLNFNVFLLAFIPGLISLGIFIYSYYFLSRSRLSLIFSFIVISAFIWQISQGFLMTPIDIEDAKRVFLLTEFGSVLTISNCLLFSLIYTKVIKRKLNPFITTLIYLPSIFLIIAYTLRLIPYELKYTTLLGYVNDTKHPIFTFESIFFSSYGLAVIILFVRYWIISKNKKTKYQAAFISIGFFIPFIQGIYTEIILPEIYNSPPIPLTVTFITFFSVGSIIALTKYNLLSYSPYKVTDNIIEFMSDAILISDNSGIIRYTNNSLLKMLGYTNDELIGQQGFFLLADKKSLETVSKMIVKRQIGSSDNYEVNMKTKEGKIINVSINASPYYKNKEVIGALSIIHDITSERKKTRQLTEASISGEEKERKRLSQELHDGTLQNIAVIKMNLEALDLKKFKKEDQYKIESLINLSEDSIKELRAVTHNLHALNDNELLCDAINRLIKNYNNTNVTFNLNVTGKKPEKMNFSATINVYRVLQEFINNAVKHSNSELIKIDINYNTDKLNVNISDNGCGFNYDEKLNLNEGLGLKNMNSRIRMINGDFTLTSNINEGTKLFISIPL
jgi:PAS domain S-box-containing protein